jgi:hypothetical protein
MKLGGLLVGFVALFVSLCRGQTYQENVYCLPSIKSGANLSCRALSGSGSCTITVSNITTGDLILLYCATVVSASGGVSMATATANPGPSSPTSFTVVNGNNQQQNNMFYIYQYLQVLPQLNAVVCKMVSFSILTGDIRNATDHFYCDGRPKCCRYVNSIPTA